jgi:hypothetical protein
MSTLYRVPICELQVLGGSRRLLSCRNFGVQTLVKVALEPPYRIVGRARRLVLALLAA